MHAATASSATAYAATDAVDQPTAHGRRRRSLPPTPTPDRDCQLPPDRTARPSPRRRRWSDAATPTVGDTAHRDRHVRPTSPVDDPRRRSAPPTATGHAAAASPSPLDRPAPRLRSPPSLHRLRRGDADRCPRRRAGLHRCRATSISRHVRLRADGLRSGDRCACACAHIAGGDPSSRPARRCSAAASPSPPTRAARHLPADLPPPTPRARAPTTTTCSRRRRVIVADQSPRRLQRRRRRHDRRADQGVNIALGILPLSDCPAFDTNRDGKVTIDELIHAVNRAECRARLERVPARSRRHALGARLRSVCARIRSHATSRLSASHVPVRRAHRASRRVAPALQCRYSARPTGSDSSRMRARSCAFERHDLGDQARGALAVRQRAQALGEAAAQRRRRGRARGRRRSAPAARAANAMRAGLRPVARVEQRVDPLLGGRARGTTQLSGPCERRPRAEAAERPDLRVGGLALGHRRQQRRRRARPSLRRRGARSWPAAASTRAPPAGRPASASPSMRRLQPRQQERRDLVVAAPAAGRGCRPPAMRFHRPHHSTRHCAARGKRRPCE